MERETVNLMEKQTIFSEEQLALNNGLYSVMDHEARNKLNPHRVLNKTADYPWKAFRSPTVVFDYVGYEMLAHQMLARFGFDLLSVEQNVFVEPTKKIGKEKPWSGLTQ